MLTGIKTTHYTLGYDHKVINKDLDSLNKATKVDSMALHAQKAGKDTGKSKQKAVSRSARAGLQFPVGR